MSFFDKLKDLDLYRKLPADLAQGTVPGSILSIVGIVFMSLLFIMEFSSYMSTTLITDITVRARSPESSPLRRALRWVAAPRPRVIALLAQSIPPPPPAPRARALSRSSAPLSHACPPPTASLDSLAWMQLDQHHNDMLQINFNMTLPRLQCAYASVDVSDLLGTHRVNVTKNLRKWRLGHDGVRLAEVAAEIAVPHTEVVGDGEAAALKEMAGGSVALEATSMNNFIKNHDLALINFYAPWCHWSRALAPVWEKTAKTLAKDSVEQQYRIALGRVDCTKRESQSACREQHIAAFPSVIVYRDGHTVSHEHYHGDRTAANFMAYIKKAAGELHPAARAAAARSGAHGGKKPQHSAQGCLVSGFVEVRKVPGNFHIEARSTRHSFAADALDLSHSVQQLSFGPPLTRRQQRRVPRTSRPLMDRLKGKVFTSDIINATYEHYIKVSAGGRLLSVFPLCVIPPIPLFLFFFLSLCSLLSFFPSLSPSLSLSLGLSACV